MARFSSFIFTDRGTEVSRMGHSSISSTTYTHHISVHVRANKLGEGTKASPFYERTDIYLDRGYGDYSEKYLPVLCIDEDGSVRVPRDFLERVEEHNKRIREAKI